ncbi:MAG: DUF3575 domain-containing protein [Bdellovibrionaceae bacterium]|nr:DUF3575 domain-containing protein [Pseudobdellovibrionaceae bacterium]
MRSMAALVLTSLLALPAFAQDREPAQAGRHFKPRHEPTMNLRFNPLAALLLTVDGSFDFMITPHVTIGPKLTYINFKIFDVQLKGLALGGEGRYHFNGAFNDGVYLNGILTTISIEASAKSNLTGETATAKGEGLNYGVGLGYHWFWDSFNLNLGLVLGGTSAGKIEVKDSTGSTVESTSPNLSTGLDFKIGFTF